MNAIPPRREQTGIPALIVERTTPCPHCGSGDTADCGELGDGFVGEHHFECLTCHLGFKAFPAEDKTP